jgi:hypothetical protein
VEEIRALGRFPERKVVDWHYEDRYIKDSVDKKSLQFGIAKSETPTRREAPSWGQLSAWWRIGIREIDSPEENCISALKSTKPRYEV